MTNEIDMRGDHEDGNVTAPRNPCEPVAGMVGSDGGTGVEGEKFQLLSDVELGMVRHALSLPSTDWRSKVSFDEQRRLLATLDAARDDASDLVDAGDALGAWMTEKYPLSDFLLAVHNLWRNCPARSRHRRWKRQDGRV